MRVLGVDFGLRFLGLALFDGYSSLPLEALEVIAPSLILPSLEEVCRQYVVGKVVFGLPYLKDGKLGSLGRKIKNMGSKLQESLERRDLKVSIDFVDEQLTSFQASQDLKGGAVKRNKKRSAENSLAAVFILRNYLFSLENKSKGKNKEPDFDE